MSLGRIKIRHGTVQLLDFIPIVLVKAVLVASKAQIHGLGSSNFFY